MLRNISVNKYREIPVYFKIKTPRREYPFYNIEIN